MTFFAYSICEDRLFVLGLDIRYFPGRCGYDPQALVAHAVKKGIKLAALGGFVRCFIREEKLIHRNLKTGHKIVKHLEAGLLPLILDIRQVMRGDIQLVADLFPALVSISTGRFYGLPESLEIVKWCWSLHGIYFPWCFNNPFTYIVLFLFSLEYVCTVLMISQNNSYYLPI